MNVLAADGSWFIQCVQCVPENITDAALLLGLPCKRWMTLLSWSQCSTITSVDVFIVLIFSSFD